ncbi:MAG TPA: hypothetical protein VGM90_22170 [Kofleriaceae bacterium]|jgi:hypothetical protein
MRALGVLALLAAVGCGGGGDPCVTPTTWCADGAVMRCVDGQPMLEADCTALSTELGLAKACSGFKAGEDRECVDVQKLSCSTADAIECAPNRMAQRVCVETDFGMTWDSRSLQPDCSSGQQCFPSDVNSFACVTPPVMQCPAGTHCEGLTLVQCAGNATAGYVIVEQKACPNRCQTMANMSVCD